MKKLRHSFLALSVLLISSGAFVGNASACPGENCKGERAKMLKEKLELSDEQSAKVDQIFKDTFKGEGCKDAEDRKECWEAKKGQIDNKISAILTEPQKKKFAALKEKRAKKFAQMKEHGDTEGGKGKGERKREGKKS